MATSPTQRTLALWQRPSGLTAVVEKWNPHVRIRQDLFGFIDILHVGPDGTYGIQCTSRGGMSARKKKILEASTKPSKKHPEGIRLADMAKVLLAGGWLLCIEGWDKDPKERGYRWKREWLEVGPDGELFWTPHRLLGPGHPTEEWT